MNPKIERVCKEIDKTKGKIGELQARLRELERQKDVYKRQMLCSPDYSWCPMIH